MARYLVTGAAGFIASKVTEFLLNDGHEVVGVDNLNDSTDVRLKDWRLAQLRAREGFQFERVDIADDDGLGRIFEGRSFDAVVNLAARAGVRQSVESPGVYFDTNQTGTLNLLERCRRHDVKKFVLASTSSLYGADHPLPYVETLDTSRPLSPYAASKKAAEVLCYTYHYLHGIDTTVLRYFTVYGPAGRPDMSPFRFVQWISEGREVVVYGDGSQSRDFTYVDDIARGTIAGLRPLGYEVVNLGSDKPVALVDMIRLVEDLTGREACLRHVPAHPTDVPATWADIGKAERLLGWRPQFDARRGFAATVEWYREHRDWGQHIRTD